MNFIAHIQLSGPDPAILTGNYIADLIKLRDTDELPQAIYKGVLLHRFIDSFTDEQESNRDLLEYIYPKHHKYAPVLLDIYFDYFLIRHWSLYNTQSFDDVCEFTYQTLKDKLHLIPNSAKLNIANLLNKRWLTSAYATIEGLERTFSFLKKRMSRPEIIEGAAETLISFEPELEAGFLNFYPKLIQACSAFAVKLY